MSLCGWHQLGAMYIHTGDAEYALCYDKFKDVVKQLNQLRKPNRLICHVSWTVASGYLWCIYSCLQQERDLCTSTHTHTHIYIYIYIHKLKTSRATCSIWCGCDQIGPYHPELRWTSDRYHGRASRYITIDLTHPSWCFLSSFEIALARSTHTQTVDHTHRNDTHTVETIFG